MVNCVVICGRLTRNPELKRGASGTAFCQFSIAFNDRTKDEHGNYTTSFVNCTAWGKTAEFICNYTKKGSQIVVSGRLQENKYQRQDGTTSSRVQINVESVDSFGSNNSSSTAQNKDTYSNTNSNTFVDEPANDDILGSDIADDDLPF